jgi:hypothetical protein
VYAHIFAAAAEFYQLSPWKTLGKEIPIEIRFPLSGSGRVVVVTGAAGDVYGLSVYDSFHDLKRMFQVQAPLEIAQKISWVTLCYEDTTYIAPEDLEAIAEHDWPIANQKAYPLINRMGRSSGAGLYPPTKEDLFWLEAALPALNEYFQGQDVVKPTGGIQLQELTLNVRTSAGPAQVELHIPARENSAV